MLKLILVLYIVDRVISTIYGIKVLVSLVTVFWVVQVFKLPREVMHWMPLKKKWYVQLLQFHRRTMKLVLVITDFQMVKNSKRCSHFSTSVTCL